MQSYKKHFADKKILFPVLVGIFYLGISLVVQYFANGYANSVASGHVNDLILSNIRVYEVGSIFIYGALAVFIIVFFLCEAHPKYLPFVLKSTAVFIVIRSLFIILTHTSEFPLHAEIEPMILYLDEIFNGRGDGLFFSGHTGMPFLMALIFWNHKVLRIIFLFASIILGIIALLGHLHYSIDIFAAFFITYGIFHICKVLFKKDWRLLKN